MVQCAMMPVAEVVASARPSSPAITAAASSPATAIAPTSASDGIRKRPKMSFSIESLMDKSNERVPPPTLPPHSPPSAHPAFMCTSLDLRTTVSSSSKHRDSAGDDRLCRRSPQGSYEPSHHSIAAVSRTSPPSLTSHPSHHRHSSHSALSLIQDRLRPPQPPQPPTNCLIPVGSSHKTAGPTSSPHLSVSSGPTVSISAPRLDPAVLRAAPFLPPPFVSLSLSPATLPHLAGYVSGGAGSGKMFQLPGDTPSPLSRHVLPTVSSALAPQHFQAAAAAAAAEMPLYPWLMSRHGRVFPGRFAPGPHLPEFLFQPFRKPKRIRTAFSPSQLLKLEHAFEKNHYVVGQERKQLAHSLNLSETQVKVWFQNRRTKHKRSANDDDGGATSGENDNQDCEDDDECKSTTADDTDEEAEQANMAINVAD